MSYYYRGFLAIGLLLITVSFVFVFSYVGYIINKEYARVTIESPIHLTGLDPQNPVNLFIFAVLISVGTIFVVKGLSTLPTGNRIK